MRKLYTSPVGTFEVIESEDVLLESIDLPPDEFDATAPSNSTEP